MNLRRLLGVSMSLALGLGFAGCSTSSDPDVVGPIPAAEYGAALFADPAFSDSGFNRFSCATCHSAGDARPGGRILSGHSLRDSAFRKSYWGGYELRLINAVSFCSVYFMRSTRPLDRDEPSSRALYEYLASISPERASPALPLTVVKDIADVPRKDPVRGEEVYRAACLECHGEIHSGAGRISDTASILPEVSASYAAMFPGVSPGVVVIEKVRHGQFFGIGGNMPPFAKEILSDEELGAMLAYLGL